MKKPIRIVRDFIISIGAIFSFIIVAIISCKLITLGKEKYVASYECTKYSCNFNIFKGNLGIGSIFFTNTHINISQYRCDIRKGVIGRDKVAVAYIDGQLVIVSWEQYREFFRAKCAREDFEKLEVFLYE